MTEAQTPVHAAQYLRMSTEHQRYSLENQAAVIAAYAITRGYKLVETYADPGKSGLTLAGRPGLKQLLADVLRPDCPFEAVLVLDVSRWGRFQDPDQAAHYEFLCREAGVTVNYCAEPFENDGAAVSNILKNLKRVMAGEYSRELSEKVLRAQLQQARLGYKQGGSRPYGVRRVLIQKNGSVRTELKDGETKALSGERVIFLRGSKHEIRVIREVFRLFTGDGWRLAAIARHLNQRGVPTNNGRSWTHPRVRSILTSELSLGYYVWNKGTRRIGPN
ncbi:recombinase family protein [Phenylobacterium sp. LjRoot225]|uniref:recombinase family protein n=1 Tax=Phenylobacterium sp. LjRoot225 TaxID=3342285 RepID=UPI003ECEAFF4